MSTATTPPPAPATIVSGKILRKESEQGIANILVELFDLDAWRDPEGSGVSTSPAMVSSAGDGAALAAVSWAPGATITPSTLPKLYGSLERIGSAVTDARGEFQFSVAMRDFNLPGKREQKPDLLLLVLAPDEPGLDLTKRVLHVSTDVRANAGSKEAYIIKLPTALLKEKGIPFSPQPDESSAAAQDKVSLYISQREREQEYSTGVASYHGTMAAKEVAARTAYRADLVRKIATDLSAVPVNGVIAADGDNIQEKNAQTVTSGIAKANAALGNGTGGVPVNLYLTPADRERLHTYFDNATGDYVEIPDSELEGILFRTNSTENPGTLLIHDNPIARTCANQSGDERCAQQHTGLVPEPPAPPPSAPSTNGSDPITSADIAGYIARLVNDMPSPDIVLQPALTTKRGSQADVTESVNDFALQKGPAEVPAFYDVNYLQIAFDHVWKQLFDEAIPNLAYTADTIGKSRFGIDSVVGRLLGNGRFAIDPLYTISPVEVPPVVAKLFDITKEEFNEMSYAIRDQLVRIATAIDGILATTTASPPETHGLFGGLVSVTVAAPSLTVANLRAIQSLAEQGERLIDSVRHDDYYTLHRTLQDLHDRMTGTYNFTVFAADKDYHSVNFGLLTTYRQLWTPLTYQAGKLIKTIPLSPKEERKYSLKVTRTEKRSSKESRKNNSSISQDVSSTSRVESEIMAKAQTKTNFGLNAEGDFNIGISSGKSTTTFGVEALAESSQNRKDLREAVVKATQDYKSELSTEVVIDDTLTSESTTSGTITNPNDELAVTYLFYELQKRYRISEQLYRVMPVVLVAQEVPAPDQITEAWVIANDWIINRCLLDDSFRPTLQYLANKSVGDDFALRELRKNLRQQRNLVDTLQIEFSAASTDADNRYKALETAISNRIDEEHSERDDGVISDIGNFFGADGPDPEAAKARELAAKDAHQYALEKAEKVAAALRQEVNTLHTLTDEYNKTLQARLDNETKVKRLLVHLRNNIFYYMQAIWSMEPPDQRFLRLYQVPVPILELESRSYRVKVEKDPDIFERFREPGTERHTAVLHGTLKHTTGPDAFAYKPLVEVADLDTLLGFKGNYMVFPLKEHNALTEFMAAPYVDSAFGAMDPDELSNVTLDQYSKYVCCLHDTMSASDFEAIKPQLRAWLEQLLAAPVRNGDEIVIPTNSLFIEMFVDQNAILEKYKRQQRELDVFKVQEEVRKAGLDNLRRAARLLNDERGDPDIEKKIVVAGTAVAPGVDVGDL